MPAIDIPIASLIGSVLMFIASLVTLFFNRRESKARIRGQDTDTLTKLDAIIDKVQARADKLYDEKVACELTADKLRNDLAIALVDVADLKAKLANATGYIQGMTDPLMKLQEEQKKALAGGRRVTDGK